MNNKFGKKIFSVCAGLGLASALLVGLVASPAQAASHNQKAFSSASYSETKECKAAKKKVKTLKKRVAKVQKQKGTSIKKVAAAQKKYVKALNKSGRICQRVPAPTPPQTFSGDAKDPRPVNWVRPADGSGLPGSNFYKVQVDSSCPVTVSKVEMAEQVLESGHLVWILTITGENYSSQKNIVSFSADVVNKDGSNWNAVPSRGWLGESTIMRGERELNPWEEWQYSTVVNKNNNASIGDLQGEFLGARVECL